MPWVDPVTGEASDECAACEQTRSDAEVQIRAMEVELRQKRSKISRLENDAERALVAKRDGADWKDVLTYWQAAFPDKRISSKGIKSARATKFFQRLEAGASVDDVKRAIDAAKLYKFVTYGKRTQSGSKHDLAVDLEDIVSVGHDARFDSLVEIGRSINA